MLNEENIDLFFKSMFNRQEIWWNRNVLKTSYPWSDDPILNEYKFTNVYREQDRNSQWEINNIIKNRNLSDVDLIWQICFFRIFNNTRTFEYIQNSLGKLPKYNEYDPKMIGSLIIEFDKKYGNVFTNAYFINPPMSGNRTEHYAYNTLPDIHSKIMDVADGIFEFDRFSSPEEKFRYIDKKIIGSMTKMKSVANFIAYEFYLSLTYISKYTNRKFFGFTEDDWTNIGPGAKAGLELLFGKNSTKDSIQLMIFLRDESKDFLAKFGEFKYVEFDKESGMYTSCEHNINLHQIEFWLCEFSKYWKVSNGVGRKRIKFKHNDNKLFAGKILN
jgi:hypothetical protein